MLHLVKTNANNTDFIQLVQLLDADLAIRDGKDHAFYNQFNKIDAIKYAVVAYINEKPVGCGAIKEYDATTVEVKRMYTLPEYRGKGVALQVLQALEEWAATLHFSKCILETGKKQPEAIALYKRNGYKTIPNYGQYAGVENSVCFEKVIG